MSHFYRVYAEPFASSGKPSLQHPCSFDVLVNNNDQMPLQGAVCGFSGYLSTEPLWPFIYFPQTGKIDFGTALNGADRLYTTDLHTTQIRLGAIFHLGPEGRASVPNSQMKIMRKVQLL